jgi:hypothetical protein
VIPCDTNNGCHKKHSLLSTSPFPNHPAGDALYLSGTEFNLEPLVSEYYGDRAGTNYYSVAVVPAVFCTSTPAPTLASLRVSVTHCPEAGYKFC